MNAIQTHSRYRWSALALATLVSLGAGRLGAQETNAPLKAGSYAAFQIVADRNIFNPNRFARSGPRTYTPRPSRRSTSFTLTGIMSYGAGETPGTYAFFDGTNPDLRKALQQDGAIANFKVAAITFDSVTLQSETNQTVLKVGMQMRQESAGHWSLVAQLPGYGRNSYDEGGGFIDRRRGAEGAGGEPGALGSPTAGSDTNSMDLQAGANPGDPTEAPPEDAAASPAETLALPPGPASSALERLMQLRAREEQQTGNR